MKTGLLTRAARWCHKGSLTIEAVIVFSVLLLAIFCLLFSFLFMYQRLLLTKTAAAAAEMAVSLLLSSREVSLQESQVLFQESLEGQSVLQERHDDLARKTASESTAKEAQKISKVRLYIYGQLAKSLQKPQKTSIIIFVAGGFPVDSLCITLQQEIRVPFGELKAFFTGQETVTLTATGVSTIIDPAQYIRNIDLLLEGIGKLRNYVHAE